MHTSKILTRLLAIKPSSLLLGCCAPCFLTRLPIKAFLCGGDLSSRGARQGLCANAKHEILLSSQLPFPGGRQCFLKACVSKESALGEGSRDRDVQAQHFLASDNPNQIFFFFKKKP